MIELYRKDFSKAVAKILLAYLPNLRGNREMNGGDTVDSLTQLYAQAKAGGELHGMPDSNPDPKTDRDKALAAISASIRNLASARVFMERAGLISPVGNVNFEIDNIYARLATLRIYAEEKP